MDSVPLPVPAHPRKRKPVSRYDLSSSSPISLNHQDFLHSSDPDFSDPSENLHFTSDITPFSPSKKLKLGNHNSVGITPAAQKLEKMEVNVPPSDDNFDDINFDDMDMDLDIPESLLAVKDELIENEIPAPARNTKLRTEEEEKKPALPSWVTVQTALNVVDDTLGSADYRHADLSSISILEDDGALHFYWLDYLESNGKVYFIGKVQDRQSSAWLSCCVGVENIERNLYVLPRNHRMGSSF